MSATTRWLTLALVSASALSGCGMRSVLETDADGLESTDVAPDTASSAAGTDGRGLGPCGHGGSCDPEDLAGETCALLGAGSGTLSCDPATCTFDLSLCTGEGIGTGVGTGNGSTNGNGTAQGGTTGGTPTGLGNTGQGGTGGVNLADLLGGAGTTGGAAGQAGAAGQTGGFFGGGNAGQTGGFFGGGGAAGGNGSAGEQAPPAAGTGG